jgi:formylglycine-generating enzyme required for sulfatase activity
MVPLGGKFCSRFSLPLVILLCTATVLAAAESKNLTAMVRVPAGEFLMGSNEGPEDERPQHKVEVGEFSIDRTPVTNAQFAVFLNSSRVNGPNGEGWYDTDDNDARIHRRNGKWVADSHYENHPAVEVSWFGAAAYCQWAGKRLPTEAEWEKAARGMDGRKYPWGNEAPDRSRAQFGAGYNQTVPVGSFPKGVSTYGLLDMAGNTWEWVSSVYLSYPYNAGDGREDLTRQADRGTRGGGHDSTAEQLSTSYRGRHVSRNFRAGHHNIGFRCAR